MGSEAVILPVHSKLTIRWMSARVVELSIYHHRLLLLVILLGSQLLWCIVEALWHLAVVGSSGMVGRGWIPHNIIIR